MSNLTACVMVSNCFGLVHLPPYDFYLVLMCHSLSPEQVASCTSLIAERWPEAVVVRIATGWLDDRNMDDLYVSNQPLALLEGLRRILRETKHA